LTASQINSNGLSIKDSGGNIILDASAGSLKGISLSTLAGGATNLLKNPTATSGLDSWIADRWGAVQGSNGEGYYFWCGANTNDIKVQYQRVNIANGNQVTLTFDCYTQGCNNGAYFYMDVELHASDNSVIGNICNSGIIANKDWGTYSTTQTITTSNVAYGLVRLIQVGNTTNTAVRNIMCNSGGRIPFKNDNTTFGASFGDYYGTGNNILGQITPGNAGAFIANAAIGNALIGNAVINNAKIGDLEVNGRKISGNTVGTLQFLGSVGWGGAWFNVPQSDDRNANDLIACQFMGNFSSYGGDSNHAPIVLDIFTKGVSGQRQYQWQWDNIIVRMIAPGGFGAVGFNLPPGDYWCYAHTYEYSSGLNGNANSNVDQVSVLCVKK
jgi:hypothetical protein